MSDMTAQARPDRELRNLPDVPPVDEVDLGWDNCDRWSLRFPDGKVVEQEEFGYDTGAEVRVAVSRGGLWVWVCIGCKAEDIPRFGMCPACEEYERKRWAAGHPF